MRQSVARLFWGRKYNTTQHGQWALEGDHPSIGIILCAEKDDVEVEYALSAVEGPRSPKWQRRPRQGGHDVPRAALVARKTARRYGTPVYYAKDGKVVALRP